MRALNLVDTEYQSTIDHCQRDCSSDPQMLFLPILIVVPFLLSNSQLIFNVLFKFQAQRGQRLREYKKVNGLAIKERIYIEKGKCKGESKLLHGYASS